MAPQLSAQYRDQSARTGWLHHRPAALRTLALALWAGNDLDVEKAEAIVAAVLDRPPPSATLRAPRTSTPG